MTAVLTTALLQLFLSVTPVQAASVNDCPGGSTSGSGSSSCPNLNNDDLLNQRRFPNILYRGDSRLPYDIFTHGFASRGANDDIVSHVQGDRAGNSNYISTTGTVGVAEPFARSQGLRNLESVAAQPRCTTGRLAFYASIPVFGQFLLQSCVNGQVTAESFVYVIDPVWARNAVYVPDQIRGNTALYNHYASQDEWAYVHRIPNYAIIGVRVYRMTAHATNGLIATRTITFAYDRFIGNPHHVEARVVYNPGTDASSHWTATSDLNTPALPANPYTRGCTAFDRCRS
ncbi:hypothetical protein ABZ372_49850 [Streptomyces sp. NPDC005921]|uniref:hypothetical protein n=1 Tax=Streptomyces sp. NPDC005827 TaxID=3157070 RepID=UPI0033C887E6